MTGIFGYYLRVYVTANFGEKYDNGVKLMLDSGLLNETAAQCAVICRYVDTWCMTHSGKRQEAFGIAVYTVRHYYYDLKKRYDIFNKNNKDYEKTASSRPEQEGRDKNDGRD